MSKKNQQHAWRIRHPIKIVNFCFLVVFLCSTLLTWREIVVLQNGWTASQKNRIQSVAAALDRHLQYSVDKLQFYRAAMQHALSSPISTNRTDAALAQFDQQRQSGAWQIRLDTQRGLPVSGISDDRVRHNPLLARDEQRLENELIAALEFGAILQLADPQQDRQRRTFYTSRAGFYLSSTPHAASDDIASRYHRLVTRPYFHRHTQRNNPDRGVRWTHTREANRQEDQVITASLPLDYQNQWYGVLAMDFSLGTMNDFLNQAMFRRDSGEILLLDNQFQVIASSAESVPTGSLFSQSEREQLTREMAEHNEGGALIDTRYVSWAKLNFFDGVLIRIYSLKQSLSGEFGSILLVLGLLWALFSLMLLGSWYVIRRMVRNMFSMQETLQWRAWFDAQTHLFNRGAFIERAKQIAQRCQQQQLPLCVIQLDLDHFKRINDTWGHQTGDKALSHAASILRQSLRGDDIAGRVGGEEFCIVLPGALLPEAVAIAERIRERLSSKEILVRQNTTIRISASFGVSCAVLERDYDFEHLQSIADRRLYQAKQAGRNRVSSSD
ncbi:cellulose biosynthesis regulator diguanylate cyclase DgcQ [Atlantibacter sp.]|uniref:cellulose biosynthesis regulator diguanylate cyclase DgcQ n=1 Tax=Atlantibacter sp. TaxID=1903473 RepID=UPI0028A88DA5|nr:cellulose biosynthesis regulator diguanylate cyclase DgcQ [Atlantibacter sp.]